MDPLHRSQSRESAQSAKSTKLSSPYALSSASSGSTSSRKGRSADPETTVADVSSTRQPSQRPPAAGALSDFNTRTVSEAALPSSERPNPTPVASTAGVFAGDFTHEAVEAGSSEAQTNSQVHGTTTAESSISVTTSSQHGGSLATSPQNLFARDSIPTSPPGSAPSSSFHASASNSSLHWANGVRQSSQHQPVARSRSRTRTSRRISGVNVNTHSSSPGSESTRSTLPREEKRKAPLGVIGVCALDTKARSKPSRNILSKLIQNKEFDVIIFGDKVILDEEVENWPECDYLISFFSDGFPLDKAIAYDKLRKPFCVNDLPMQTVLWDRRLCLKILDKLNVPTPKRIEVNRDGGPVLPNSEMAQILYEKTGISLPGPENGTGGGMQAPKSIAMLEDDDILCVDGEKLKKPFVEKPVSGEDHNIRIYYPTSMGGGGRRLFRKVNNKSSEKDDSLKVPRCMTEPQTSYIYEQFVNVEKAEDIKAYTVGPNFCHAETRKSPVVDGLVKRNPNGKELRYVCSLTEEEKEMATKVVNAFGQRVCGFDLLRADGKSYVIDVNGWSFVKDNNEYYDQAAKILKELFVNEKLRKEGKLREPQEPESKAGADPGTIQRKGPGGHRATLKGLFHSPSLAKLGGGHHQSHSNRPGSPEIGTSTLPMSSPPSMEHPLGVLGKPIAASQPQLPPPAMSEQGDSVESRHSATPSVPEKSPVPPPASKAQWKLKGMVSVIRHADRTPKQKFKFTFHTKPFVDLLKGHQEEVLLIGEAALDSVIEAVHTAMKEGIEDPDKLRLLRSSLLKKGAWIGTKVQIKPMFREKKKAELAATEKQPPEGAQSMEEARADNSPAGKIKDAPGGCEARHESSPDVTLSRISAKEKDLVLDKLQLIVKWGGEPTHSARYQAKDLGDNLRADLMIMNRECVEDVTIYSSSERRVTTSAQIFASAFLAKEDLSANFITVRKDLLDDSNAAKDEMDKVKKKLKQLLREGDKAPSQFAWPDDTPEPFIVVRTVVELMKFHRNVMHQNFKKLQSGAASSLAAVINPASVDGSSQTTSTSSSSLSQANAVANIQPRWCCSEDAELFRERWEKLFKEFCDAEKVDPSKISELYDTMKFDALHNRQFLEWVFTPDASMLDEESVADSTATSPLIPGSSVQSSRRTSRSGMAESLSMPPPADKPEKHPVSSRIGFRRHSQHDRANSLPKSKTTSQIETTEPFTDSYFNLYKGNSGSGQSKAKFDARLAKLRELYKLCKVLFDYIGPQEYGISPAEKLEIGLLTSLPLLKEIVADLEEVQAYEGAKSFWYFTKESHIYTLLNCILEGGVKTKIERKKIPELDYLAQINFELYESQNETSEGAEESFNYSIRITISPGCHTFDPLDVQLDSKHCIGCAPRRSLTDHGDWKEILETLREKFTKVNLPKTFTAINLSEKGVFRDRAGKDEESLDTADV